MKQVAIAVAVAALFVTPALAAPRVGQPAPAFTAVDSNGERHSLSDFAGRTVILEWHNPGCPFVQKHYQGNMQKTQAAAIADMAVWLTVNSGAPGKQGHMDGKAANARIARDKARPTAYLLDPAGTIGRAYDARTTPQMFVIDGKGVLRYAGAIDDKPTADVADIAEARNHVLAALSDMKARKPVAVTTSRPYGCAVKYSD